MLVKILDFQKNQALGVVQFQTELMNTFEYVSSTEAIKKNYVEVKEVSEGGSVNDLFVINLSDKFIFFMDGDILQGAKQNRVINTSMLIAPNTKINIPVSCVEAGRWRYSSSKFHSSEHIAPSKLRSEKAYHLKKNLELGKLFYSAQNILWSKVNDYETMHGMSSKTSDLNSIYEGKRGEFDEYVKGFEIKPEANGTAVFVKNKILNIDVFNREDIYSEYFPKILQSAAMETYHLKESLQPLSEAEAKYKTNDFFDKYDNMEFSIHKSLGAGNERRFETKEFTGLELMYEEHLIHLTSLGL
ncbi:MAG: hypothetical protein JW917_11735 [Ignavibacteria bacterium]|nr:hypothetical protein [Ignavibacteria bacterium]